jgi:FkbM family methyltransferase
MRGLLNSVRRLRDRHPWLQKIHAVARRPYYQALVWLYPRGVATTLSSGASVRLHPSLLGMRPDMYEAALTRFICDSVAPNATVLDIGAHLGLHTLTFSRLVGPAGHVIAVEASPANCRLLREHVAWNGCSNVEIIEAAVGDREDRVLFRFRPDPTDPSSFANSLAYDIGGEQALVAMRTIDDICDGVNPAFIKIDIEGAELLALRGAAKTLDRAAPLLVVGIHPDAMRALGTSPPELLVFLAGLGYNGRHLDGRPVVEAGVEEIIFTKQTTIR